MPICRNISSFRKESIEYIRCNKKGSLSNIGVKAAALRLVAFSSEKGVPPFLEEKVALAYMSLNSFILVDS